MPTLAICDALTVTHPWPVYDCHVAIGHFDQNHCNVTSLSGQMDTNIVVQEIFYPNYTRCRPVEDANYFIQKYYL